MVKTSQYHLKTEHSVWIWDSLYYPQSELLKGQFWDGVWYSKFGFRAPTVVVVLLYTKFG